MKSIFKLIFGLVLVLFMIFPTIQMQAQGHRSGCHAAHSCPSDHGTYVCGDTGNDSQCPGNDSDEDDEPEINTVKKDEEIESDSAKSKPTLPSDTISEGIEISGPINYVVDGDTLDVNQIRIRLSLVNTPEIGDAGFYSAKNFVEELCLDKNGEVDIDDGQRQGSFGREIGVVYCDGKNLNSELISKGYAIISTEFCEDSEFSAEPWAKSSCQTGDNENKKPNNSNQLPNSLFTKQEQHPSFDPIESSGSESYTNSKFGVDLEHPADWKVGDLKNGIQFIKEDDQVYVEIRKHNLEPPDLQLEKYVDDYIKKRNTIREDFNLLSITETTISGNLPAYKAIYTFLKTDDQKDFTTGERTNKILRIWTLTPDSAYIVAYVAEKDKYDLYLPIAEKIIDTLQINPDVKQSFSDDDDSNDNDKDDDSENSNDGGDKDCSDFDKKNFKVQPGDPYGLDRDGDGIACET